MKKTAALLFLLVAVSFSFGQKSRAKIENDPGYQFTEAAVKGDLAKIKAMLAGGIDVNITQRDWQGWTALTAAATFGQTEIVKYLIEKGADVNVKLDEDETVLYQAAQNENCAKIVPLLLAAKADINTRTKFGGTALMRFVQMRQNEAAKLLLRAGADTTIKDNYGWTAFHQAVNGGNGEMTKLLIVTEDVNAKDGKGDTPLMWAGASDRKDSVRVLVDNKADVNAVNNDGKTPLMITARRFYQGEVKILLDAGANVKARDKKGWNALMFTAFSTYLKEEIGAHGQGSSRWLLATILIEDLIKAGSEINAQNENGETALMLALKAGNTHFAETLLKNGADKNLKNKKGLAAKDYINNAPKYERERLRKLFNITK